MDDVALAVLKIAETWEWPSTLCSQESGETSSKSVYKAITPKLLAGFITESQALGGTLLDQFWEMVEMCHPKLKDNVTNLRDLMTSTPLKTEDAVKYLFDGIDRKAVDFTPVLKMTEELFTHLGIALMNPGGRKSGGGTPFSVSNAIAMETDQLLQLAAEDGFGKRKQGVLKALVLRRDGGFCPFSGFPFSQVDPEGVVSILAHVIPNSVHDKPHTMKCIAMFAGMETAGLVRTRLNSLGNVMTIESDTHTSYNDLRWGIEACVDNGTVKYIYRKNSGSPTLPGPIPIRLRDGEEIKFGGGLEADQLGPGPDPLLCNLQLAVARVLRMSGAAEVIMQWKEDADDSEFPHVYIASIDFCDILTAKLLLSGRASAF